ncbi:hypothetical protein [Fodinibius salsisoli]|uniref:NIPSNAP protein n=1 Tax=Fodinibius salsisoli TaxID=2820877 RepID=A0ABT3PM43_9BACT|nr:hypothetical protein [Fodinibius salsisoli]MCW9707015.1 hypothetical protein [Fodinibius salsisoli]
MNKLLAGTLFLCFMAMSSLSGFAQEMETPKAKKMEGHTWHQVVMVKFKPGSMDEAKSLIHDHFMKAGMSSETEGPQMMQFKSGEWDMMFIWKMDNISDMDWEVTPDDEKWWAEMAKQEGGMDKAMAVMKKYLDLVHNSTSYLAVSEAMPMEQMSSNE